jgi:heme-degrading monooxygenase HmoA
MVFIVLFRSRFSDKVDEEYDITEEKLTERVREIAGSDFAQVKSYQSEDGERLAVVWWRDRDTLDKWRADPQHREAQRLGREKWYSCYELSVAEVIRTSSSNGGDCYPMA